MSTDTGMSTRFDYTVKIILLGDHSIGKSSFLADLADRRNARDNNCRCLDYRPNGHVELDMWKNGKRILAKIVDTGGQEKFRSITASYYRGAQGCLLMFDAEKTDTFAHVHNWHADLEMYTSKQPMSSFLVGVNTQSQIRQVTPDQAERCATQLGMQFHELTIKKKSNGVEIVQALLDRIIIHASRLPSLTIDIMPYQIRQHFSEKGEQNGWGTDTGPQKFKCSC